MQKKIYIYNKINMKESQEDEMVDKNYTEQSYDSEIMDLSNLINSILDYYTFTQSEDEGEEWKRGTSHEQRLIPEDVNELVGKAFKTQLKKFIKK